jgi:Uma2 family endonuclease
VAARGCWTPAEAGCRLARLLELWALSRGVRLRGYGSTTYRRKARQRGLEPDECYYLSPFDERRPEIAIEVAISSGGIDKLDVYRGLEVPDVWFFREGHIAVYQLGEAGYVEATRSARLPALDLRELEAFVSIPDQADAVEAYWKRQTEGRERA